MFWWYIFYFFYYHTVQCNPLSLITELKKVRYFSLVNSGEKMMLPKLFLLCLTLMPMQSWRIENPSNALFLSLCRTRKRPADFPAFCVGIVRSAVLSNVLLPLLLRNWIQCVWHTL